MSAEVAAPQTTPTASMIKTLGIVATVCGLIIVGAYQGTYSSVQANKRIALERAVVKVLPGRSPSSNILPMTRTSVRRRAPRRRRVPSSSTPPTTAAVG